MLCLLQLIITSKQSHDLELAVYHSGVCVERARALYLKAWLLRHNVLIELSGNSQDHSSSCCCAALLLVSKSVDSLKGSYVSRAHPKQGIALPCRACHASPLHLPLHLHLHLHCICKGSSVPCVRGRRTQAFEVIYVVSTRRWLLL